MGKNSFLLPTTTNKVNSRTIASYQKDYVISRIRSGQKELEYKKQQKEEIKKQP